LKFTKSIALFVIFSLYIIMGTGCAQKNCYGNNCTISPNHPTMKPYTVHGKRYYPTYVSIGDTMKGVASWYGPDFHGKQTSNCETYNMYSMTAAHKTWPMNTMVKVSCKDTGKSTVVRINDRGPFISGRIIDLSFKAGKVLGLDTKGITPVTIEVLGFAGKIETLVKKQLPTYKQKVLLTDFAVQVGSFMDINIARSHRSKYQHVGKGYTTTIEIAKVDNMTYYRVWIRGFKSEMEAKDFIRTQSLHGAIVVRGDIGENCKRD